jgi:hypothetical protein
MKLLCLDLADIALVGENVAWLPGVPIDQVFDISQVVPEQLEVMFRPGYTGDEVHCQPVAVGDDLGLETVAVMFP